MNSSLFDILTMTGGDAFGDLDKDKIKNQMTYELKHDEPFAGRGSTNSIDLNIDSNMAREEIARYFEDLVVTEELDIPFGGYEGKLENDKGNDFYRVLFSFLRKLEGGVDVYSHNFILVFWDSRWEGPMYGNHCWRFGDDELALTFIQTAFCEQEFEKAMHVPTYDQKTAGETRGSLEEKRVLGYRTPPKSSFNDDPGALSKAQKKARKLLGEKWADYNMKTNQFPEEVADELYQVVKES